MVDRHTPGPWKARDYPNAEGGIWIDCDAWRHKGRGGCQGGTLATAHKTGAGTGSVEANARLIAAAPDLLEALKAARELLSWWQGERGDDIHSAVMESADAAIAKASGVRS